MKKRYIIIVVILLILVVIVTLYQTFAIDINSNNNVGSVTDIDYDFNINGTDTKSVVVKNGTTKYFDMKISNTNEGTVRYGIAYNSANIGNVSVVGSTSSPNPVTGLIKSNSDGIYVSLEITNNSGADKTVNLVVITGYENGGDLVVPSGYTLVS